MKARIPLAAWMVCALGCLLAAAPAGATVTTSNVTVTSPTGTYLIADEVTPNNSITGTGTSNGTSGDSVDVRCYLGNVSSSLVSSVAVAADGTFSFSGTLSSIAGGTCVLRAVPHGDASAHPPGTASTFTGPTLAIGDNRNSNVSGGPNDKALEDYHLYVSQLTGGFDYDSLGGCSISDSWVFDPITFAQSPPLDYCNAWFWWRNGFTNPGYQPPTRSELQVDGTDAFLPGHISNIATTQGFPATSNPGLPSLTYSYSIDPASGNLALDETDQVVKCSPGGAYPPTASNCSSFVPTGIQIRMHIVQGHGGRIATVTQWISSTDGRSHAVNLLENNEFYVPPSHDGELNFPWS